MSGMSISYYFPFRRIKIVHQSIAQDTKTARIDILPDCFVSEKFGPLMIFLKRWFTYNKITQGEMHEYQEKAIDYVTPSDCFFGRDKEILEQRHRTKAITMLQRRKIYRLFMMNA